MSRNLFVGNTKSYLNKLFFVGANRPFVIVQYKKLEDCDEQVKLWYGIVSNPIDFRIYSPSNREHDIFELKSKIKLIYAYNSLHKNECYVQSDGSSGSQNNMAKINLNYFFEPWMFTKELHKDEAHTIIVGANIRDWHDAMKILDNPDSQYSFNELVKPMHHKILAKLSEELFDTICTEQIRF